MEKKNGSKKKSKKNKHFSHERNAAKQKEETRKNQMSYEVDQLQSNYSEVYHIQIISCDVIFCAILSLIKYDKNILPTR